MKQKRRLGRPPKSDSQNRRREILSAALDLFSQQGFEATSIRQIASQVGISDPALYSHFKSKQEILEDLFELFGPKAVFAASENLDVLSAAKSPWTFAENALNKLAERWFDQEENKFFRLMLLENLTGNIPKHLTLDAIQKPMRQKLTELAAWLITNGIAVKTDPEWMSTQFTAPIAAIRTEVAIDPERHTLPEIAQRLRDHLRQFSGVFLPGLVKLNAPHFRR